MSDVAIAERTLPHSLEAERAVIGAALLHPDAFGEAAQVLEPSHFFRDAHRRVWDHMRRLSTKHVELDLLTVKDSLIKSGELDDIGGPAYLMSLTDGVPRSSHIGEYARIVREKWRLRSAIYAANKILVEAYEAEDDAQIVVDRAEQALFEIAASIGTGGFRKLSEILPQLLEQIEAWSQSQSGVTGLSTGFRDLDGQTRGLQPGNLIILAARPSQGKSALALNIAKNVAAQGSTVGVFSLEMSETELAVRALTDEARINGHRLQAGYVRETDWGRIAHAIGILAEYPLYIDESPFVTAFDIRTRARRLKAEHDLSLLVIDYTQLMVGHERRENRALELGAVSRMLKAIAKELKIPVIALSQLSRKLEERTDKRPILSDLRESGALEQDADMVWFIHRPVHFEKSQRGDYQNMTPAEYETLAELIIAKQRNGPVGTVELTWRKEETRFEDRNFDSQVADQRLPMGDR